MKFPVIVIRNRLTNERRTTLDLYLSQTADYFRRHTPLEFQYSFIDTNLDLRFKDYGVRLPNLPDRPLFGLDGVREQLRQLDVVPNLPNGEIWFCYQIDTWDLEHKDLGNWTYPTLFQGAAFSEFPSLFFRLESMTHEPYHGFHRLVWAKGIPTHDTMDWYDKEFEIEASDGNRARNLEELSPYWPLITGQFDTSILVYVLSLLQKRLIDRLTKLKDALVEEVKKKTQ